MLAMRMYLSFATAQTWKEEGGILGQAKQKIMKEFGNLYNYAKGKKQLYPKADLTAIGSWESRDLQNKWIIAGLSQTHCRQSQAAQFHMDMYLGKLLAMCQNCRVFLKGNRS